MTEEVASFFGISAGIGIFMVFVGVLWGILNIILFFKIWEMTNDVREIKEMFKEQLDLEHPYVDDEDSKKGEASS